ncbi:protein suppressor of sable-like isoform X2 [Ctenocephalides felis]|uniref:protein suppressor of sable-like isoform X2 n=1 Tax=Ctenocephalides felis TaxID=7515 RepID=UPI000E6E2188|nr:protein suppressor of sable-like isoform X2 [Ctenocephalides felis]
MVHPPAENSEDLEDGEIETDDEDNNKPAEPVKPVEIVKPQSPVTLKTSENAKYSDKKPYYKEKYKKSSKHSKEKRSKSISESNHCDINNEDDWASNVEKAIANAIRKESDNNDTNSCDNKDNKEGSKDSRGRKRRNKSSKGSSNKESSSKRPKVEKVKESSIPDEDIDEDELLGIRGGSPINNLPNPLKIENFSVDTINQYDSYSSGESHDSDGSRSFDDRSKRRQSRGTSRRHERKGFKRRNNSSSRDCHPLQEPDGVCLFFMQGKCQKNDDCQYSHDAEPTRKMELCKFYLMDCCAKKDKCLYLHSDFPCKFYHMGLKCFQKDDCKFAHGKPLTSDFKNILLKHIETAPKEILGDFPRLSREGALNMVNATQQKLMEQQKTHGVTKSPIPSLFELNIPKPKSLEVKSSRSSKTSSGVRKSRWCNSQHSSDPNAKSSSSSSQNHNTNQNQNYLNIQNLNGLLTSKQINELSLLGVTKLDELNQLTVKQLNDLGITMIQINEIQLNALNIQKITNLTASNSKAGIPFTAENGKDLDLRIPPPQLRNDIVSLETCNKDVDMRMMPIKNSDKNNLNTVEIMPDLGVNKKDNSQYSTQNKVDEKFLTENKMQAAPVIDFSQYLKDSRLNLDKEVRSNDIDDRKNEEGKENESNTKLFKKSLENKLDGDNKVDVMSKLTNEIDKLLDSVVDDDEALQIDENLYYSDEGAQETNVNSNDEVNLDNSKEESKNNEKKIEISYLPELPASYSANLISSNCDSMEIKSPEIDKQDTNSAPEAQCESEADTDFRKNADTDLRRTTFGDTDLRHVRMDTDLRRVSKDIDLRKSKINKDVDLRLTSSLEMPFKPVTQYTPASEIDGSITSHPPIIYKVYEIEVSAPDYSNIIRSIPQSQALIDPRLKKIFKLSSDSPKTVEEPAPESVNSADAAPKKPRVDPRKRKVEIVEVPNLSPKASVLDIQVVLQTSDWYKELSTNQKIMVNQQLAAVSGLLKQFNQDKNPNKIFDLAPIKSNPILCSILHNLGIYLTENGQFAYIKDSVELNRNPPMIESIPPHINMGPVSMGPCMNQLPMMPGNMMNPPGFDNRFQPGDPRVGNGLLGPAPNMPLDGYNINGQYNHDNYNQNFMNYGFNNDLPCDEENYYNMNHNNMNPNNMNPNNMNLNNMRGNRNDVPHSNHEHWNNRHDRNIGPRRNFNDRGRGGGHRPRDRGGGSRKDKMNRK